MSVFLPAFLALFPLVNPIGAAPLFATLTQGYSKELARKSALKTAIYTVLILAVFEFAGGIILNFFEISLGALQIAGGLLVANTAWEMTTGKPGISEHEHHAMVGKRSKSNRSLRAAMKHDASKTIDEVRELPTEIKQASEELPEHLRRHHRGLPAIDANSSPIDVVADDTVSATDVSFSPMAMPLLAGPGAIGITIALAARHPGLNGAMEVLLAILLLGLVTLVCMLMAGTLVKLLGDVGMLALRRILGFIILAIAVVLIVDGINAIYDLTDHSKAFVPLVPAPTV